MTKSPRENRVPIMMSDEELTDVDDWRYGNRIATRSDAIRRLAQIGLRVDFGLRKILDLLHEIGPQLDAEDEKSDQVHAMWQASLGRELVVFSLIMDVAKEIAPLTNNPDFRAAIAEAEEGRADRNSELERARKFLGEFEQEGKQ
jgi:hypothetical protein